jgi:AraC-like DNA-binding protein
MASTPPAANDVATLRFSTDDLPEQDRMAIWHEEFGRHVIKAQFEPAPGVHFSQTAILRSLPGLSLAVATGSAFRAERTLELIGDGNDDLILALNIEGTAHAAQFGHEATVAPGEGVLLAGADVFAIHYPAGARYIVIGVPRKAIAALVNDPEAALLQTLAKETESLRLLKRYVKSADDDFTFADPELRRVFATHVQDLVALLIGATRDGARWARGRGVRAARLLEIAAEIRARFADPAFSPSAMAAKLGLTPRYVQELLSETGRSFTERVLELRLQKARAMLEDPRQDGLKVSDIAFACGFNDISYFNRCFRRRFGASPSHYRGGDGGRR